jgi:hypothetical protein
MNMFLILDMSMTLKIVRPDFSIEWAAFMQLLMSNAERTRRA